jgi:hypothetical protein
MEKMIPTSVIADPLCSRFLLLSHVDAQTLLLQLYEGDQKPHAPLFAPSLYVGLSIRSTTKTKIK